ncbi:MAG: N-acetylmuramoyl-L-alanine amidase [Elusimicrobiaceae bacterium]|nr:N-acetylmuramoyl-L-alanine amidase [Elusimicrobiaceae bacterium]
MRKIFLFLLSLFFLAAPSLHAQGKTSVAVLGKNKGAVSSIQVNGKVLVDARATAKKIGGSVEVFSAAKQIKIAFPGMYAILSAPLKEAIINGNTVKLTTEVVASGGKIYVPVSFFTFSQIEKALDRQITFENNTIIVEKNYNLAFVKKEQKADYDRLVFSRKGEISFSSEQPNKHTIKVLFPNTVLKRNVTQRLKDDFVRSFSLLQKGKNVELKVILAKQAKVWNLAEEKGSLVLSVSAQALPMVPAELPTMSADQDAEELDLNPSRLTPSVMSEVNSGQSGTSAPVLKPTVQPVMKDATPVLKGPKKMRIVIDPGHGGKDPGAVRRRSAKEKDMNLTVAKHLYDYLKKQGFEVKLTRDDDSFVTLAGRSKIANEYKADLFVSIHTNAAKRTAAHGFEVYFRSDKATDKEAAEVAAFENEALQYEETHYNFVDMLLQSLAKNEYMNESSKVAGHVRNYVYKEPGIGIAVSQNNSIRQANFYVLKGVQSPAILVEMGYISSPKDRLRLNNKSAQKKMAIGIGKGIVSYAKAEGWLKK